MQSFESPLYGTATNCPVFRSLLLLAAATIRPFMHTYTPNGNKLTAPTAHPTLNAASLSLNLSGYTIR